MASKITTFANGLSFDRLPVVGKIALGVLLASLVGLVYFVIFFGDVDAELTSARQKDDALQSELARAQNSKVEYQKDLDEKTRREQLAREQRKLLPDDSEAPAFLSALQSVATLSGVGLASWSPTEEQVQDFFAKVPMKLTLTGKFHQIAKFFHSAGQLDRIINIENIQIRKPKVVGAEVEVEVDCLATAFRSVRPGEAAARKKQAAAGAPN